MTLSDRIIGLIRTYVPSAVGAFIAFLVAKIPAVNDVIVWIDANFGDFLGGSTVLALAALATAGVTALYWLAVRELAKRWPWVERLLGVKAAPVYVRPVKTR